MKKIFHSIKGGRSASRDDGALSPHGAGGSTGSGSAGSSSSSLSLGIPSSARRLSGNVSGMLRRKSASSMHEVYVGPAQPGTPTTLHFGSAPNVNGAGTGSFSNGASGLNRSSTSLADLAAIDDAAAVAAAIPGFGPSASSVYNECPPGFFDSPNPPDNRDLFERLLKEMLDDMGVRDDARRAIYVLPDKNKWSMITQHYSTRDNRAGIQSNVKFTPEYFMRHLPPHSDRVSQKLLMSLRVSLATHTPQWIAEFIQRGGLAALVLVHQRCHSQSAAAGQKNQFKFTSIENEVVRCLKGLLNVKPGMQAAMAMPDVIESLCLSLDSDNLNTRKLVADVLTAFCYLARPRGHQMVLRGLDFLNAHRGATRRFEPWLLTFANIVNGRGILGSLVGATGATRGMTDEELNEYALSNLILVNGLVRIPEDFEYRIHLRNQLLGCNLMPAIETIKEFADEFVKWQITQFEADMAVDMEEFKDRCDAVIQDFADPMDLFKSLLRSVEGHSDGIFWLTSLVQHLLCVRGIEQDELATADLKANYLRFIDTVVAEIVLDRKGIDPDFSSRHTVNVQALIQMFENSDKLQRVQELNRDLEEQQHRLIRDKERLELELCEGSESQRAQFLAQIHGLNELLQLSERNLQVLHRHLYDVQSKYTSAMAAHEAEIAELLAAIRDDTDDRIKAITDVLSKEEKTAVAKQLEGVMAENVQLKEQLQAWKQKAEAAATQVVFPTAPPSAPVATGGAPPPPPPPPPPPMVFPGAGGSVPPPPPPSPPMSFGGGPPPPPPPPPPPMSFGGGPPPPPPPPPPPMSFGGGPPPPPPPPPPPMGGGPPPPPPPPPPPGGFRGGPPPPPPPPPGFGGPPPPPPPPGIGGPPPPPPGGAPPPPGGFGAFPGFPSPVARRVRKYSPKVTLKQLQWDKLPDVKARQTIWATTIEQLERGEDPDEKWAKVLGEDLFANLQDVFPARQPAVAAAVEVAATVKKEISVLESKRAYNINIMLGRMKQSFGDIRRSILALDFDLMTRPVVTQFLKYVPTAEEIGKLAAFSDDLSELAKPDRFLVEMIKVERYEQRLKAMDYYLRFNERTTEQSGDIRAITKAAVGMHTSEAFRDLLQLILTMGNYMNTGFRGNATGFRIGSINKLVDTKSADNKRTLLHFLVDTVSLKLPKLLKFTDDLKDTAVACRVSFESMTAEMNTLNAGLRDIDNELERFYSGADVHDSLDRFKIVMAEFSDRANAKLADLRAEYAAMKVEYEKSVLMFGEDPSKMGADEFFGIVQTFLTSFQRVHKDILKQRENAEKLERRRRQAQSMIVTGADDKAPSRSSSASRNSAAAAGGRQRRGTADRITQSADSLAAPPPRRAGARGSRDPTANRAREPKAVPGEGADEIDEMDDLLASLKRVGGGAGGKTAADTSSSLPSTPTTAGPAAPASRELDTEATLRMSRRRETFMGRQRKSSLSNVTSQAQALLDQLKSMD
ncbi:hypothetical protein H9P43_004518 [Blastocladiella emersonii ATCC 22665]|nr:hypothetical protein H9P43_004518 [Blastocladiella emersonii ATCC 22665]